MSTKYIASNWRLPNQAGLDSYLNDNYGLSFNGSSSVINFGNISELQGATNASFSMWLNVNSTGTEGLFNQWGTGTDQLIYSFINISLGRIDVYVNTNLGFRVSGNSIISSLSTDEWFNLTFVYDGTQATTTDRVKAYINNQELTGNVVGGPTSLYSSTTDFILGTYPSGTYFDGKMSEFSIFDYSLSSTQISTLYGSSSLGAGNPMALKPQPVGYWPLGDNSASNPLTQPNEAVEDASVFNFNQDGFIDLGTGLGNLLGDSYTDDLTFSAWIKVPASSNPQNGIFVMDSSGPPEFALLFLNNNQVWLEAGGNNIARFTSTGIDDEKWHHLVIVYDNDDATNTKLYFDNSPATKTTILSQPSSLNFNGDNTVIGTYFDSRTSFRMTAQLSNAQVWNTGLSSSEVSTLYNSGVPLLTGTQPQASNLKAWYKLDQSANWDVSGSGYWDIPDDSGNGNSGISSGMTSANLVLTDLTRNLPYDSYSFNFDAASSDYIDLGTQSTLNLTGDMTISAWINTNNVSSGTKVIVCDCNSSANSSQFCLEINRTAGKISALANGNYVALTGSTTLSINRWYHVVLVRYGNTGNWNYLIYLDSVIDGSANITNNPDSQQGAAIGRFGNSSSGYFDGKISNVSIFNEALTSTEVQKLYSNGMPQDLSTFTPAPIAWWTLGSNSFFNGSDFICKDLIGSNDGTSANAGVDAVQGNTPRSEANGTGTNMDIPTNLEGQTKYSSNNSWSINMSESARVADTP